MKKISLKDLISPNRVEVEGATADSTVTRIVVPADWRAGTWTVNTIDLTGDELPVVLLEQVREGRGTGCHGRCCRPDKEPAQ
jgi:hypothetical protein